MTQLLQNAVYGTALILAAALLRRVLRDRLTPGARLALWAACLFRLLTPAAPASALSLWGLLAPLAPASRLSGPAYDTMSYLPPATGAFVPQVAEPGTSPDLYCKPALFPWEKVLTAVWVLVGIALAARYALSWLRTRRAVACAIPVEGDDPRYASLPKFARLREGPMEGAPLTFGAVKPTVVLSPGLEGEALDCVLAHEGVHAKRRDNLWHYAMAAALIIHWWNPAVWLMARLLRRDIELSCDRAALKKLGADRRAEYANALVSMAAQKSGPAFCQTFGRKAAEERILSVMKFKKTSVIGAVLSLALVLAVTAAFASAPKEPDAPDTLVVDGVTLTGDAAKYASQLYAGMTRDEVHQLLGEPHNFLSGLYGDTYLLERLQGLPVTEPATEAPLFIIYYDHEDFNGGVSKVERVIYRTGDGEHIDLIPFTSEDRPNYVNPDGNAYDNYDDAIDPTIQEALEAAWRDQIQAMVSASLDKVNGAEVVTDPSAVADGKVRTASGIHTLCDGADCDVTEAHYHANGQLIRVYYENPDLLCARDDCDDYNAHLHDGTLYAGHAPAPVPVPADVGGDPLPVPSAPVDDQLLMPLGTATIRVDNADGALSCGVEGCTETRYHAHNEGRTILLSYPCPVEGCTITGNHLHGDVCYSCNGAGHEGGVCDGSCYTYTTLPEYPASGHHSDSHHEDDHH